jgi:hypothetical protein
MSGAVVVALCLAYFFGWFVCAAIFAAIGNADPHTFADSWTGDTALDLITLMLWPLSLVAFGALSLGRWIGRHCA